MSTDTYAKLAPDSILNKKIKEIMRYTGGHRTSPFSFAFLLQFEDTVINSENDMFRKNL